MNEAICLIIGICIGFGLNIKTARLLLKVNNRHRKLLDDYYKLLQTKSK